MKYIKGSNAIIEGRLKLTPAQQDRLLQYSLQLFQTTRQACGYVQRQQPRAPFVCTGWLQKRHEATMMYEGDFAHRATQDELFALYNTSYNVPQRAVRVWKAKANKKLLNTPSFVTLKPEGSEDQDPRVELADRYFRKVLDEGQVRYNLQEGLEAASVRGEGVMKITRQVRVANTVKEVRLVMLANGEPLRDTAGRLVFSAEGIWEPDPEAPPGVADQKRLRADPRTKIIGEPGLSDPMQMPIEAVRSGLDISLVPYKDFYVPPTARDLRTCDGIFQAYDVDVDELLNRVDMKRLSPESRAWFERLKFEDNFAKADSGVAEDHRGEDEILNGDKMGKAGNFEAWIRFDSNQDGKSEELQVVIDHVNEQLIYADYMEEVSPTHERPYEVLRLIKQPNRWYGIGFYELLRNQHEFVDRQRNRIDARSGSSGSIMWQKRGAILDTQFGVPLEFNGNHVFTIADGFEGEGAFGAYERPAMDQSVQAMMEKELMSAQLISGTLTPADGEFSDAPSNETATGQNYLAEESETLNDDALQYVIKGLQETLGQGVVLTFGAYDVQKATDIMGLDKAKALKDWVEQQPIRNLMNRVTMLMTRQRSMEVYARNQQVVGEILPTWEAGSPEQKARWYDLYLGMLKALEIADPEKILGDRAEIEMQAEQEKVMMEQAAAGMLPADPTQPPDAGATNTPQYPSEVPAAAPGGGANQQGSIPPLSSVRQAA